MIFPNDAVIFKSIPLSLECEKGSRTDVSLITTDRVDSSGDKVIQHGGDWDTFRQNGSPVYYEHRDIQIGRALWVKPVEKGWLAKTQYASRPQDWPNTKAWPADAVFDLVQKGRLGGKSVTLLPKETRAPDAQEAEAGVKRVIQTWTVLGFSVCEAPVNEDAEVIVVSKAKVLSGYYSRKEVESRLEARLINALGNVDHGAIIQSVLDKLRGKI